MLTNLIQIKEFPVRPVLQSLLSDKTTGKNIIWATDSYAALGAAYADDMQMTVTALIDRDAIMLQPRVSKEQSEQIRRSKNHAEVFTSSWICNQMNNFCDAEWFGRKDVFNRQDGHAWTAGTAPITFPKGKTWKHYADSRRLEITCGEAPFIVSRYDMTTGEEIPIQKRIGLLDRKLRVVNESAADEEDWLKWTFRAFQSVYGYEYQGDNLLLARINLLMTFVEYLRDRWKRQPAEKELIKIADVITWNLWQMDGLKGTVPLGAPEGPSRRIDSAFGFGDTEETEQKPPRCRIYDWRRDTAVPFEAVGSENADMKLDFVIGNPPYQAASSANSTGESRSTPVYHQFMDAAYALTDKALLITPARFLFNIGKTPKEFNKRMLNSRHFSVLTYYMDSTDVFPYIFILGGVAITYYDKTKEHKEIGLMLPFPELFPIVEKVQTKDGFEPLSNLFYPNNSYHFIEQLYTDKPKLVGCLSDVYKFDLGPKVFVLMPDAFFDEKGDNPPYACINGNVQYQRVTKYIEEKYITCPDNYDCYKVFVAISDGSGSFGEVLSSPFVGMPKEGCTISYLSIGKFDDEETAINLSQYLKTKFLRALLNAMKISRYNPAPVWNLIPVQDFTPASDIDWSQSIARIDQQLYHKYALTDEEIDFIETHVKEMN